MSSEVRFYPRQLGNRQTITTTSAGGISVSGLTPIDESGGSYVRVSTRTPGFRSAFLKGKTLDLPMNPFSFESTWSWGQSGHVRQKATNLQNGTWTKFDTFGLYPENGTVVTTPVKSIAVINRLKLQASRKFLDNLKDQDINLPVAIAEGGKTIGMIADLATQLGRAGLAVRRGNLSGAARILGVSPRGGQKRPSKGQSLAQNWLELKYGWQPLLNDIYGVASAIAKANAFDKSRTKLESESKHKEYRKTSSTDATAVYDVVYEDTYVVKYVVYFTEPAGIIPSTALGLGNPAAVVWELVPFSFVVDWIFPLGSFLNNMDAVGDRVFSKGSETIFYKGTGHAIVHGKPTEVLNGTKWEYDVSKEIQKQVISCVRNPMTGFPANHFPILQNPLTAAHAATALALVAQVFSGAPVKNLRL